MQHDSFHLRTDILSIPEEPEEGNVNEEKEEERKKEKEKEEETRPHERENKFVSFPIFFPCKKKKEECG